MRCIRYFRSQQLVYEWCWGWTLTGSGSDAVTLSDVTGATQGLQIGPDGLPEILQPETRHEQNQSTLRKQSTPLLLTDKRQSRNGQDWLSCWNCNFTIDEILTSVTEWWYWKVFVEHFLHITTQVDLVHAFVTQTKVGDLRKEYS